MKKIIFLVLAVALVLAIGAVSVFAAERNGFRSGHGINCPQNCGDANCDGSCNNPGTNCNLNYVDADGDGICDNQGTGLCGDCGGNFVDADGDGICDNRSTGLCGDCGGNFVDADGDGICDNQGCGNGNGGCTHSGTRPLDGSGSHHGAGHHGRNQ